MKKILFIPFLFIAFFMSAAPIGEKKAREIAVQFFSQGSTKAAGVVLDLEWAGNSLDGARTKTAENMDEALMYIYNRSGEKGFVIIAGDDRMNPIIAFSYENSFDVDYMAPGARAMLSSWCKQVEAVRNSPATKASTKSTPNVGEVVKKYETAQWDQREPYNNLTPTVEGQHTLTGCVATAMAIIARYHQWPESGTCNISSYSLSHLDTPAIPAIPVASQTYDYSKMPLSYHTNSNPYTDEQKSEVAKLCYHMGVAVQMLYGLAESGAHTDYAAIMMAYYFGYSKSTVFMNQATSDWEWAEMLKDNIINYGPTLFSGRSSTMGHAFVLDGYTSTGYFSINYGWGGSSNGYYLLPNQTFYNNQGAAFYMTPDKTGTTSYTDFLTLYPAGSGGGLKTDASTFNGGGTYNIKLDRVYNSGITEFNGDVILALCGSDGAYKSTLNTVVSSANLSRTYYYDLSGNNYSVTLPEVLSKGDRIRVMYKGTYSSDTWQWAEAGAQGIVDEILLIPLPDELAESLNLSIEKGSKVTFQSVNAVDYKVSASGVVKTQGSADRSVKTDIDISGYAPGTYTFSFSSPGGDPYNLTITF